MPVDDALASEQWIRFQYCRDRGHLEFINKADKCDKFFAGEQWLQSDLNALALQRRPAITINKIISTLGTLFGEQIYNRSETIFRPSTGAKPETAEILTKVFKQIGQNNQLPWTRSELFADGIIRSRGFVDVRLDFTDSMIGEVSIDNLNSKNVVIDPDAEEYDPDGWNDVFTTKWVTPQDVAVMYSEDDAEYLKIKDGSSFPYGYDSIERVRDRFGGVLPKLHQLQVKKIWPILRKDSKLASYLPDCDEERLPPRNFFFQIFATLRPQEFAQMLSEVETIRKEKRLGADQMIKVEPDIWKELEGIRLEPSFIANPASKRSVKVSKSKPRA